MSDRWFGSGVSPRGHWLSPRHPSITSCTINIAVRRWWKLKGLIYLKLGHWEDALEGDIGASALSSSFLLYLALR